MSYESELDDEIRRGTENAAGNHRHTSTLSNFFFKFYHKYWHEPSKIVPVVSWNIEYWWMAPEDAQNKEPNFHRNKICQAAHASSVVIQDEVWQREGPSSSGSDSELTAC